MTRGVGEGAVQVDDAAGGGSVKQFIERVVGVVALSASSSRFLSTLQLHEVEAGDLGAVRGAEDAVGHGRRRRAELVEGGEMAEIGEERCRLLSYCCCCWEREREIERHVVREWRRKQSATAGEEVAADSPRPAGVPPQSWLFFFQRVT